MNFKIVNTALTQLHRQASDASPEQLLQIRVAARWLRANLKLDYDLMLRLQILEGVANVPVGTWWRKGKMALPKAKAHFENSQIQSAWFDPGYTGMYGIIERVLMQILAKHPKVQMEPAEIVSHALMGMSFGKDTSKDRTPAPLTVGISLRRGILDGTETPDLVAKGTLSRSMIQRTMDKIDAVRKEHSLPSDEDGNEREVEDRDTSDTASSADFFRHMMFQGNDSVSKKLQGLLRDTWEPSAPMTMWMDLVTGQATQQDIKDAWVNRRLLTIKDTGTADSFRAKHKELEQAWDSAGINLKPGEVPSAKEVAELFNMLPQDFSQKHWRVYWGKFFHALWADTVLRNAVSKTMNAAGFDGDIQDPTMLGMITERVRSSHVAGIFLFRQILSDFPGYMNRLASRRTPIR